MPTPLLFLTRLPSLCRDESAPQASRPRRAPRHWDDDRVGVRRRRLECATVPPLRARLRLPSPATRPQLLLDPGRPRPLQGPAAVDPLYACLPSRAAAAPPSPLQSDLPLFLLADCVQETCNFDVLYSYLSTPPGHVPTSPLHNILTPLPSVAQRAPTTTSAVRFALCLSAAPVHPRPISLLHPFLSVACRRHPEGVRFRLSTLSAALGRHRAR